MPALPQPIWTTGDPWRILTDDVTAAGSATLLTRNGTAHMLELDGGVWRWVRVPPADGHLLPGDLTWQTLIVDPPVTPCGARYDTAGRWHVTTPAVLIVASLDIGLAETPAGVAAIAAGHTAPQHPALICQHTPYCRVRPRPQPPAQ